MTQDSEELDEFLLQEKYRSVPDEVIADLLIKCQHFAQVDPNVPANVVMQNQAKQLLQYCGLYDLSPLEYVKVLRSFVDGK